MAMARRARNERMSALSLQLQWCQDSINDTLLAHASEELGHESNLGFAKETLQRHQGHVDNLYYGNHVKRQKHTLEAATFRAMSGISK